MYRTWAIIERELRRFRRSPTLIVISMVFPLVQLIVLGNAFAVPGLPVDTHVGRLSRRLGLTEESDPVKVEHELNRMIPAAERGLFSLRMIEHGRRVCLSRRPRCEDCVVNDFCPSSTVRPNRRR